MGAGVFIKGDFLDVYPYMDWLFLLNHEGDLLMQKTREIIEDPLLFDYLFRQEIRVDSAAAVPSEIIEVNPEKFEKIASLPDRYSFCDMRFFYSNLICASQEGLDFIPFETQSQTLGKVRRLTDAPICSIFAKYMTVFAPSLEDNVTTLYGVKAGDFDNQGQSGSEATRVGVATDQIHYYTGGTNLQSAKYTRKTQEPAAGIVNEESEREQIDAISEAKPQEVGEEVDFVFNSNGGLWFKRGNGLEYVQSNGQRHKFNLSVDGKVIKVHTLPGAMCFEFLEGMYVRIGNDFKRLLPGECISSRGYANSVHFKSSVSAVTSEGAFLFRI